MFLLFAPALAMPITGDVPLVGDTVTSSADALGGEVDAQVQATAGPVEATVDPDDLGLYLGASLPGPGFSRPVDGTSGSTPVATQDAATSGQEEGWGPAVPVTMPEPSEAAVPAGLAMAGLLAYAYSRWRIIGPWFLMPLYSRLSKDDLLENEIRATLLEVIEGEPGLSLQELAGKSGAGWGTTVYHLQRLEQAGFVQSEKQGHHRRFYKVGEVDREEIEALGMLRNDTPRQIASYLVQDPGCNQKTICEALDISPSLAHKYLKRMEEQQLLTSQREWRSKHYTPAENLSKLVEQAA